MPRGRYWRNWPNVGCVWRPGMELDRQLKLGTSPRKGDMTTDIAPLETEYAAEPDAGLGALATSRGNLPLEAVDVRAAIAGNSASVELTQGFRNPFDIPLEATYIFPLPDRAAVTALTMTVAGRVVRADLQERAAARQAYDAAIAAGKRAG